ncbi:MAG: hypothetical protein JSS30_00095 [Verrucomicrobia bacterium]|nr:hypothetical protein [Verrucomicrobiota bacterium]
MKPLLLCALLIGLASCGSIHEMNSNMVRTNELMDENIVVTTGAQQTIQKNTAAVTNSTDTMIGFEDVIADNTETVNKVIDGIQSHSHVLSMGAIALLLLLFLPSLILVIFYFRFLSTMKSYMRK